MAILTKQQFEDVARRKSGSVGLRGGVNEVRLYSRQSSITSLFLSHSHSDKAQIEQAKIFFENLGISIYVDWADETMPEKPNSVTAQKIKDKIVSSDKFVFLATNNAIISKWCNWEIGIADTFKFSKGKMALLPLADNSGTWNGNEYLQLYPRIEKITSTNSDFYIKHPSGELEVLEAWLKK